MKVKRLVAELLDELAAHELHLVDQVEKLPDLRRTLDMAGADIKLLERLLNEKQCIVTAGVGPVSWGPVSWGQGASKKRRILYCGRPLLEVPVRERLEGYALLPELVREIGRALTQYVGALDKLLGFEGGEDRAAR
jgi:hypothetical protein